MAGGGSSAHSWLRIKLLPCCGSTILNMSPQRHPGIIQVAHKGKERAHGEGASLLTALMGQRHIPSHISFTGTDHTVPSKCKGVGKCSLSGCTGRGNVFGEYLASFCPGKFKKLDSYLLVMVLG